MVRKETMDRELVKEVDVVESLLPLPFPLSIVLVNDVLGTDVSIELVVVLDFLVLPVPSSLYSMVVVEVLEVTVGVEVVFGSSFVV